jgi:hypothetical protein
MRKQVGYFAATAALLLVGAGCDGTVKQEATVGAPEQGAAMRQQDATAKPEGGIDASVDAIVGGADDEKKAQADKEADADEVGADKASINAYGDATYEIK